MANHVGDHENQNNPKQWIIPGKLGEASQNSVM